MKVLCVCARACVVRRVAAGVVVGGDDLRFAGARRHVYARVTGRGAPRSHVRARQGTGTGTVGLHGTVVAYTIAYRRGPGRLSCYALASRGVSQSYAQV